MAPSRIDLGSIPSNWNQGENPGNDQRDHHGNERLSFGNGRDLESRLTKQAHGEDERFAGETNNGVRVDIDTGDLGIEKQNIITPQGRTNFGSNKGLTRKPTFVMDIGNDFEVNSNANKLRANKNSMAGVNQHLKHQGSSIYKPGSLDIPDTGNRLNS